MNPPEGSARGTLLAIAADRLRGAGVESAEHDASELLAFVLGVPRSRLPLVDDVTSAEAERFGDLDSVLDALADADRKARLAGDDQLSRG